MEEQLFEFDLDIDQDFLDIISDFGGEDPCSYADSAGATSSSPSISSSSDDDCSTQYHHNSPPYNSNFQESQNIVGSGSNFDNSIVIKNKLTPNFSTIPASDENCFKKTRREDRLIKNREAANKSRMKRKNQLTDMEITIKNLTEQNLNLQQSNAALRAENIILNDQNNFLKSLLSGKNETSPNLISHSVSSFHPAATSFAILGLICTFSFMGEYNLFPNKSNFDANNSHNGRVLLSYEDDYTSNLYQYTSNNYPVYTNEISKNNMWTTILNSNESNFLLDFNLFFGDSFTFRLISCMTVLLFLFLNLYKNKNKNKSTQLELPK